MLDLLPLVIRDPFNTFLRQQYADQLEEQGNELHEIQRLIVKKLDRGGKIQNYLPGNYWNGEMNSKTLERLIEYCYFPDYLYYAVAYTKNIKRRIRWAKSLIEKDVLTDPSYYAFRLAYLYPQEKNWAKSLIENCSCGDPCYAAFVYYICIHPKPDITWVLDIVNNSTCGTPVCVGKLLWQNYHITFESFKNITTNKLFVSPKNSLDELEELIFYSDNKTQRKYYQSMLKKLHQGIP